MKTKDHRLTRIRAALESITEQGVKLGRVTRHELKESIIEMIDGGRRRYGKKYFYPSLDSMVILLAERQHIQTSLRTLSRAIRELKDEFAIHRINRHIRGRGIKMICRTTAYYLLDKGIEIFKKMLRRAQRFLRPLGVPKVASDNVTLKQVFMKISAGRDLQGTFNPFKEVASLH